MHIKHRRRGPVGVQSFHGQHEFYLMRVKLAIITFNDPVVEHSENAVCVGEMFCWSCQLFILCVKGPVSRPSRWTYMKGSFEADEKHSDSYFQVIMHKWKHSSEYYIPFQSLDPPWILHTGPLKHLLVFSPRATSNYYCHSLEYVTLSPNWLKVDFITFICAVPFPIVWIIKV